MTNKERIKVSLNRQARTFTLRRSGLKYRTCQMTQNEFENCEQNTDSDWETFLRYSDEYYRV